MSDRPAPTPARALDDNLLNGSGLALRTGIG